MMNISILNLSDFEEHGWDDKSLKIITHDGIFHSDELFATALLLIFQREDAQQVQIVRSRDKNFIDLYSQFSDVFLIDIGGRYDPLLCNFDHHQESEEMEDKASVRLVFDYLMAKGVIEHETGMHLWDNLLLLINQWDLGLEKEHLNYYYRPLPSLISAYNRSNEPEISNRQFEKALRLTCETIENEVASYKQYRQAQRGILRSRNINAYSILLDDFNPKYQSLLKQKRNIRYFIYPYNENWAVAAVNSNKFPLPEIKDSTHLIFLHKNDFLAIFDTKEAAIRFLEPKFQGRID